MKVTVLIENTTRQASLTAEHGLSLLIETQGKRFLFDTGATGAFADNARKMGVELSKVDALILSHGHYDHGGGIETFLKCNSTAPVYVSVHAFGEHYNGAGKYIGLPPRLQNHPRLIPVADDLTLSPGVRIECCRNAVPKSPWEPFGLQIKRAGVLCPDDFAHEMYLVVEKEKRICFSGCAHRGVENIVHWLAPDVLIGGFHFKQLQPGDSRLDLAAEGLLESPCEYYTCHCTGQEQYAYLKQKMGSRLHALSTADVLEL